VPFLGRERGSGDRRAKGSEVSKPAAGKATLGNPAQCASACPSGRRRATEGGDPTPTPTPTRARASVDKRVYHQPATPTSCKCNYLRSVAGVLWDAVRSPTRHEGRRYAPATADANLVDHPFRLPRQADVATDPNNRASDRCPVKVWF
jgi:hypothetical protein